VGCVTLLFGHGFVLIDNLSGPVRLFWAIIAIFLMTAGISALFFWPLRAEPIISIFQLKAGLALES